MVPRSCAKHRPAVATKVNTIVWYVDIEKILSSCFPAFCSDWGPTPGAPEVTWFIHHVWVIIYHRSKSVSSKNLKAATASGRRNTAGRTCLAALKWLWESTTKPVALENQESQSFRK